MSVEKTLYVIDWKRVKQIARHLQDWMKNNDYELIDIERAASYINAPYDPSYLEMCPKSRGQTP